MKRIETVINRTISINDRKIEVAIYIRARLHEKGFKFRNLVNISKYQTAKTKMN